MENAEQVEVRDARRRFQVVPGLAARKTENVVIAIDHEIGGRVLLHDPLDAFVDAILNGCHGLGDGFGQGWIARKRGRRLRSRQHTLDGIIAL
jgi:hypothetical protein